MGRRRTATAAALGVVVAAAAVALAAPRATLPVLTPPCALKTGSDEVGLSTADARALTTAAAAAVRDGRDAVALAAEVAPLVDDAAAVSSALLGTGGTLTCRASTAASSGGGEQPSGLTPRAEQLRAELEAAFGPQSLGGFAPGGVRTGHVEGSAHYDGRALDVFFRPVTPEGTARGWAVARWAVAHAEELDVATVIFDRQLWSSRRSGAGWRDYTHPSGDTTDPVLNHEDHVHLDVAR